VKVLYREHIGPYSFVIGNINADKFRAITYYKEEQINHHYIGNIKEGLEYFKKNSYKLIFNNIKGRRKHERNNIEKKGSFISR